MNVLSVLMLLFLALLLLWIFAVRCQKGNPVLQALQPYRYAHRGLHDDQKPENSLAAFQAAADAGYGAELDVHLSADNQLVVMHDSTTTRLCGKTMEIESTSWEALQQLHLGDTDEKIPLLYDVLTIFEHKAPLIIELKTKGNNAAALCANVFEVLDQYNGVYCVESFDPRVLRWLRLHRPQVCRGQLATVMTQKENPGIPLWQRFFLSHLLANFLTVPDFIAYNHSTRRKTTSLNICRGVWGVQEVSWTVRSPEVMQQMERCGNLIIFEHFMPASKQDT